MGQSSKTFVSNSYQPDWYMIFYISPLGEFLNSILLEAVLCFNLWRYLRRLIFHNSFLHQCFWRLNFFLFFFTSVLLKAVIWFIYGMSDPLHTFTWFFNISTFGGQIHDAAVPGDSCKGGNVDTAGRFDGWPPMTSSPCTKKKSTLWKYIQLIVRLCFLILILMQNLHLYYTSK